MKYSKTKFLEYLEHGSKGHFVFSRRIRQMFASTRAMILQSARQVTLTSTWNEGEINTQCLSKASCVRRMTSITPIRGLILNLTILEGHA